MAYDWHQIDMAYQLARSESISPQLRGVAEEVLIEFLREKESKVGFQAP